MFRMTNVHVNRITPLRGRHRGRQRDQGWRRRRPTEAARGVGIVAGDQQCQGGLEQVWVCAVRARECVRCACVCERGVAGGSDACLCLCVFVYVCICMCVYVWVCVMLMCMHLSVCVLCWSVCMCVGTLSAALLRCCVKEEQHVYSMAWTPSAAVL